ncbi:MAG: adenylate/guanylate cyclase domain-containing protein [Myxococcota bacterium]
MIGETPVTPTVIRRRRRASFRSVILGSIVLLTVLVSVAVLWTSFTFGESTVRSMSERYASSTTALLHERLGTYFDDPMQALETYDLSLRIGVLDDKDADAAALVFWNGLQHYRSVRYLSYGSVDGRFVGATRDPEGRDLYLIRDERTRDAVMTYAGRPDGKRTDLVRVRQGYDPTKRPWFRRAMATKDASWTGVYASASVPGAVLMTAVKPVKTDGGQVRGVIGADVALKGADDILRQSVDQVLGTAVIVDADGLMVAASSDKQAIFVDEHGQLVRTEAIGSSNPIIRDAAEQVLVRFGSFRVIQTARRFRMTTSNRPYLVDVAPFKDEHGLNWTTMAVVDETVLERDFVQNTQQALILSLLVLLIGVLLAFGVSRRIARPIRRLAHSAHRVREGDLDVTFDEGEYADEIGELTSAMAEMVAGLRDRNIIRDALGRYVNPELASRFIENPESLALGGQLSSVTLLMSDLRGYTILSERLSPGEMVTLLNRYLGTMTEVIHTFGGTIIEFIGDAIFVAFGAPFKHEDDSERAVRCAIAMQQAMVEFNDRSAALGYPRLEMGIGVNSGEVIAGNIGSERAAKYGVIGAAVNLTARLEGLTTGGQILISEGTRSLLGDDVDCIGPRLVRVKGISRPLAVFELKGMAGSEPSYVPKALHRRRKRVERPVKVHLIHGYEIATTAIEAMTLDLGATGATIEIDVELPMLTKIMLQVDLGGGRFSSDAYAIVGQVTPPAEVGQRWLAELTFTSLQPSDADDLAELSAS